MIFGSSCGFLPGIFARRPRRRSPPSLLPLSSGVRPIGRASRRDEHPRPLWFVAYDGHPPLVPRPPRGGTCGLRPSAACPAPLAAPFIRAAQSARGLAGDARGRGRSGRTARIPSRTPGRATGTRYRRSRRSCGRRHLPAPRRGSRQRAAGAAMPVRRSILLNLGCTLTVDQQSSPTLTRSYPAGRRLGAVRGHGARLVGDLDSPPPPAGRPAARAAGRGTRRRRGVRAGRELSRPPPASPEETARVRHHPPAAHPRRDDLDREAPGPRRHDPPPLPARALAWHVVPVTIVSILFVVVGISFRTGWSF